MYSYYSWIDVMEKASQMEAVETMNKRVSTVHSQRIRSKSLCDLIDDPSSEAASAAFVPLTPQISNRPSHKIMQKDFSDSDSL
jgi:hypothetical protein